MADTHSWGNALSMKVLRKRTGLVPTLIFCTSGCGLAAAYIAYMMITKPDLSYRLGSYGRAAPYEWVRPDEIRKLWDMHTRRGIPRNPEIEALRKELGSYRG